MLTHDELSFCISKQYPHLTHGVHFWVCHTVSRETGAQIEPARIAAWHAPEPEPTEEELQALVRKHGEAARTHIAARDARIERDRRLTEADALVYKAMDAGDTEGMRLAGQYRKALRDVTSQPGFPLDFTWPNPPEAA
ncbi:phage tail assembly chaperone [Ralstonia wenshanensis]|uniref:XkdW family protein n=1 Tax=Ralstonia wenshanensis TaxID=2842456 RepID=UPI0039C68C1E